MFKLQKMILLILLLIFVTPACLFGREVADSIKEGKTFSLGIRNGMYLSYIQILPEEGGHMSHPTYTQENKFKAGYNFGLFLDIKSKHRISILPEINYLWFRHRIKYSGVHYWPGPVYTYYTDYVLSCSEIQFCVLPKLTVGKNSNIKILAGPFMRIPLALHRRGESISNQTVSTDVGAICGLRADVPVNSNFVCIEIRAGSDISNLIKSPEIKETGITLGLSYLFKIK
jgi:hypothetical protein